MSPRAGDAAQLRAWEEGSGAPSQPFLIKEGSVCSCEPNCSVCCLFSRSSHPASLPSSGLVLEVVYSESCDVNCLWVFQPWIPAPVLVEVVGGILDSVRVLRFGGLMFYFCADCRLMEGPSGGGGARHV